MISISIVSHGQMALVNQLLSDIDRLCHDVSSEVILTINTQDEPLPNQAQFTFPIVIIQNTSPKGFGENHNQAFGRAKGDYFCVLNPDVRLQSDPFPALIACLDHDSIGVAAPLVLNGAGQMDDSARRFPGPFAIVCKVLGIKLDVRYAIADETIYPDWVAGMFMLFRSSTFKQLNGFDERYFLYYEDVDICARLTNTGKRVALSPSAKVVHLAQRTSHKNLKYLRWHITSMMKFFLSANYWRLLWRSH